MLSPLIALILTVSLAAASPIWLFSDQCWNNLSVTMCLMVATTILVSSVIQQNIKTEYWAVAGIFAGMAFIVRPFAITVLPAFIFMLCYAQKFKFQLLKSKITFSFMLPIIVFAIFMIAFNLYRFGSVSDFGYNGHIRFLGSWYEGMTGNLLEPAKSPLYFAPVTILTLPALLILVFRQQCFVIYSILYLLPYFVLKPKFNTWYSGSEMFSRYWLPMIPIIYVVAAVSLGYIHSKLWKKIFISTVIILSLLGIRHEFFSVTTNDREVHASAEIKSGIKIPTGLSFGKEKFLNLILGKTSVADAQKELLKNNPKTSAILPSVSNPYIISLSGGFFLLLCIIFSILLEKKDNILQYEQKT